MTLNREARYRLLPVHCSVIVSVTEKPQQFPVELQIEISRSENFPVRPGPSRVLSQQWLQAGPNLESPGSTLTPQPSHLTFLSPTRPHILLREI